MVENIPNQISSITQNLRDFIISLSPQSRNTQHQMKESEFDTFMKSTSDIIAIPADITPFFMEKYRLQSEQLKDLNSEVNQLKDDIENIMQNFNANVNNEQGKFYQNANELSDLFYAQLEIQNFDHEAQISKLKDAILSLKANYDIKSDETDEKPSIEKKPTKPPPHSIQKDYNERKIYIDNNFKESIDTEIDVNDQGSIESNSIYESDEKQDEDINYTTGSSEIKTKAYMGQILKKIDEIEETEESNENLKKQISELIEKSELEIGDLKQKLNNIDSESESKLNHQLKINQQKYDDEFESTKLKYVQREKELIDQLHQLKKEQSSTSNSLKTELSKLKDLSNTLFIQISDKINEEKQSSQTSILEKEKELQSIKEKHNEFMLTLIKNKEQKIFLQPNSSSLLTNPRRKRLNSNADSKTISSPRRSKLKEDFGHSMPIELNESLITQYTELKQKLDEKTLQEQSLSRIQMSDIEQATKLAQAELVDQTNQLGEMESALDNVDEITENSESRKIKDEINRLRVEVNKRKTLQALQLHQNKEMEQIDQDLVNLSKNSSDSITKMNNHWFEKLSEEQLKTNEFIKGTQMKLEFVLKKLKDAEINEERLAISNQQKWCDLQNNDQVSARELCPRVKRISRPTSSISQAPPFLAHPKLPHLQK